MVSYDAMILSAHPDDAEFAMGGTLLKLAEKHKVIHVVLTKGEAGTHGTPKQREAEAKQAAKKAGIDIEFLGFKDNCVEDNVENAKKIAQIIREYTPIIIFAPYHTHNSTHEDGRAHPDHEALGKLAAKAARYARFKNAEVNGEPHKVRTLIYYMIPSHVPPSIVIDITMNIKELEELWGCHQSQTQLRNGKLIELLLLSRKHTGYQYGYEYAETFKIERPLKPYIDDLFKL